MVLCNIPCSFRKITGIIISFFIVSVTFARQTIPYEGDASVEDTIVDTKAIHAVPDSVITSLQKKKEFAYANDPAYWQRKEPNALDNLFAAQNGIRIFIYIVFAAVLLFALYRIIVSNKFFLFYSASKKRQQAKEEGEIQENLEEKIEQAIVARDYRFAVRFMYLKALRLLAEKGWIQLNTKTTNRDYLNALRSYPLAQPFKTITHDYDYIWYGEFAINEQQFLLVQKNFNQFYNSVPVADINNAPIN